MTTEELTAVRRLMRDTESLDIEGIRDNQLHRRVTAFARRVGMPDTATLVATLRRDADLRRRFVDGLTINVTNFFRNAPQWRFVQEELLPTLSSNIRMWSAGCSIGAEPYTMAMLAREVGKSSQILATDVDRSVLEKAKQAKYTSEDLREAPAHLVKKYFDATDGTYELKPEIRQLVQFRRHDLLADPLPGRTYDLVVCRNVVIYFAEDAKKRLHARLTDALKPGGVLFVGGAERIDRPVDLGLEMIRPQFYRKATSERTL